MKLRTKSCNIVTVIDLRAHLTRFMALAREVGIRLSVSSVRVASRMAKQGRGMGAPKLQIDRDVLAQFDIRRVVLTSERAKGYVNIRVTPSD